MGRVKKTITLPPAVRAELVERLVSNGYGDFLGLSLWLESLGYKISKSALHRFAMDLKKGKYLESERPAIERFLSSMEDAIDVLRKELNIPRKIKNM